MKSFAKMAKQLLEASSMSKSSRTNGMNKRGQLQPVFAILAGIIGIIFLVLFALTFQQQLFTAIPLTAGSQEANASVSIRANGTQAYSAVSGNFTTWVTIVSFVAVVILLVLAWRYWREGTGSFTSGSY